MAGLAVHPQMGRVCCGFSMAFMTLKTNRSGFCTVGGTGNVRMTRDASDMIMGRPFECILFYRQGDYGAVDGAFAIRIHVALTTECLGHGNTFIGIDVGLPVAIQTYQLPLVLSGILSRHERSADHGQKDNGTHGNSQSYPRFSAHQKYASSLFPMALSVWIFFRFPLRGFAARLVFATVRDVPPGYVRRWFFR